MAKTTKLDTGNISAKIGNIKSLAGINKQSNVSKNTKRLFTQYKDYTIEELEIYIFNS